MGFFSLLWGFSFLLPFSVWKTLIYVLYFEGKFIVLWQLRLCKPLAPKGPRGGVAAALSCPPVCCQLQGLLQKWGDRQLCRAHALLLLLIITPAGGWPIAVSEWQYSKVDQ